MKTPSSSCECTASSWSVKFIHSDCFIVHTVEG
jgi:hypothetical protein